MLNTEITSFAFYNNKGSLVDVGYNGTSLTNLNQNRKLEPNKSFMLALQLKVDSKKEQIQVEK